jgi:hypothetical protein
VRAGDHSECPGSVHHFGHDEHSRFERERGRFEHWEQFRDRRIDDHDGQFDHSVCAVADESQFGAESLLRQRDDGHGVAGDAASVAR